MSDTPTTLPLENACYPDNRREPWHARAVALAAAKQGAELIITGRTMGALEELDDEISAVGTNATIVELDQTDIDAMPRLGAAIAGRWGGLMASLQMQDNLARWHRLPTLTLIFSSEPSR